MVNSQGRRFAFLYFLSLLAILGSIWTLWIHLSIVPNVMVVGCRGSSQTAAVRQEEKTTSSVYTRKPKRTYTGERLFTDYQDPTAPKVKSTTNAPPKCQKWAVVALYPEHLSINIQSTETTLHNMLQEIHKAQPSTEWCTVVVVPDDMLLHEDGHDSRGNDKDNVHVVQLRQIKGRKGGASEMLIKALMETYSSTGGSSVSAYKNTGYLYALQQGANYILDLDYSPEVMGETWKSLDEIMFGSNSNNKESELSIDIPLVGGNNVLNSHAYAFRETKLASSWPRGYPKVHEHPGKKATIAFSKTIDKSRIGVMHRISRFMPDLDAQGSLMMGNLRSETDYSFDGAPTNPLLAPRRVFVPYNAKATLHTRDTLWALLLPTSLPTRLADIWRSFMAQSLFWDLDLQTVIVPPTNSSILESSFDNTKMIMGEKSHLDTDMLFYTQVPDLLRMLEQFTIEHSSNTTSLPTKMEALWIHLYEEGFINFHDVTVIQLWLRALLEESPYRFPLVEQRPYFQNVVLMGQFNFATHPRTVTSKDLSPEAIVELSENLQNAGIKYQKDRKTAGLVVEDDNTERVAFWVQKWREVFSHVVVRGPFSKQQLRVLRSVYNIEAHGMDESRWNHTFQDQGKYSPIANLVGTLEEFKHHPRMDGVMYIHDDMLLDVFELIEKPGLDAVSSITTDFPSNNILASGQATRESFFDPRTILDKEAISRRAYNIHVDGTFSKPNGQKFLDQASLMQSLEYWPWNPEHCIPRLVELAQDDRVDSFRESSGDGETSSILIPPWEPSDFLFVPTKYAEDFIDIATLFLDHRVFLECALPTIVDMIRKRYLQEHETSSIVETRELCSSWEEDLRNTEGMITACLDTDNPDARRYGMYHPYKLSNGIASWDAMFDMVAYTGLRQ